MVFKLDRQHRQFAAEVGVDDEGGPTESVVFGVLLDGKVDEQGAELQDLRGKLKQPGFLFLPGSPAALYYRQQQHVKYWKARAAELGLAEDKRLPDRNGNKRFCRRGVLTGRFLTACYAN